MSEIAIIECKSAEAFWNELSPLKWDDDHLFRGHGDANWALVPSFAREDSIYGKTRTGIFRKLRYPNFDVTMELRAIRDFVELCDMARLPVPGDSEYVRDLLWERKVNDFCFNAAQWPDPAFYQILALMQHFRFPTRFLDWSRNPLVALYFAASDAFSTTRGSFMAVWVLRESEAQDDFLKIVNISPTNNYNMYAQAGCFTLLRQEDKELGSLSGKLVGETCIKNYLEKRPDNNYGVLTKVTVPKECSRELLEKCEKYRVNHATIYPDYYGVTEALRTRMNIRKQEDDEYYAPNKPEG